MYTHVHDHQTNISPTKKKPGSSCGDELWYLRTLKNVRCTRFAARKPYKSKQSPTNSPKNSINLQKTPIHPQKPR